MFNYAIDITNTRQIYLARWIPKSDIKLFKRWNKKLFEKFEDVIYQLAHQIYLHYGAINRKKLLIREKNDALQKFGCYNIKQFDALDEISRCTIWRRTNYVREFHNYHNDMVANLIDIPLQIYHAMLGDSDSYRTHALNILETDLIQQRNAAIRAAAKDYQYGIPNAIEKICRYFSDNQLRLMRRHTVLEKRQNV